MGQKQLEGQVNDSHILSDDDRYLAMLGDRVRGERSRRGMTRKILSNYSKVSERYLAQLESGRGNVSIILLRQIAAAMHVPLAELVQDGPDQPVEMALILEQLADLSVGDLADLHRHLRQRYTPEAAQNGRIALIGLRGAGKSTLGRALAKRLELPFVQLNKEIETAAGMKLEEIFDLLGQAKAWAESREKALSKKKGEPKPVPIVMRAKLGKVLERYRTEVSEVRPMGRSKTSNIRFLEKCEIAKMTACDIKPSDIISHIRSRRKHGAGPSTANNDIIWLRVILRYARAAWDLPFDLSVIDDANEVSRPRS